MFRARGARAGGCDGECVEVSDDFPAIVPVRDSKDPQGAALIFEPSAWSSFVAAVKSGEFSA